MPGAINDISSVMTNPATKLLGGLGTAASSLVGNITGNNLKNQALTQELNLQKQYTDMTPAQLAAGIQGVERPLSQGLVSGVGNTVQAQLAERGLAQSPGIFGDVLAQALAPFQLQQQQLASQAYLQKLGLPVEAAARFLPTPNTTSTSAIWQQLMQMFNGKNGNNTGTIPGSNVASPNNTLGLNIPNSSYSIGQLPSPANFPQPDTSTPPSDQSNQDFNFMDFLQSNPQFSGLVSGGAGV